MPKLNFMATLGNIASIATLIGIAFGAYFYINGQMVAIAGDMEQKAVTTFKQEQKLIEMKIEDQQQSMDSRYLEYLQCQKILIEKELKRDRNDTLLKDKLEKINKNINILENNMTKQLEKYLENNIDNSK
jgi:hypothetical protein